MGSTSHSQEPASEPIAIIGLSCKFAGSADSPEKLWEMLAEGRNAWSEIPESRFNHKAVYHPDSEKLGTTHVKGAHFLEQDVGLFDAAFFNYSAETAATLDPQFRFQLESVYEALENAGLTIPSIAGTNTSVYAGVFTHDYHEGLIRDEDKLPRFLPIGTLSAMSSNRISHFFDLKGASMTVDTGCSTALVALHQAVLGLRTGEADMSIVSGCNIMLSPDMFKVFSSLGMLSPDGKSYAFDSRANGYGRGEGVATIIVKRLSDALRDGDPVRGVIRESFLNQDGKTETITSPSQEAQEALIRECYRRAGLSPADTQYFEAHGTGTPTGDPIEARSIAAVFGDREQPLRIGSVKTNIGHTEAASGLAGLIKVVLAMEKGYIPPSVNFESPNPKLKLDEWKLKVAERLEEWPVPADQPWRASVNNFGYGGTNSHVIVEGVPRRQLENGHVNGKAKVKTESKVLLFSGRDEQACQRMVSNTMEYLQQRKEKEPDMTPEQVNALMQNLAWTLTQHRTRFSWVSAIPVKYSASLDTVIDALESPAPTSKPVRIPDTPARIGMVFTGQGAQWHAMGRELITPYPVFRATLDEAERYLNELGADWSLTEELSKDAGTTRVNDTGLSIPICVAVQIALVRLLKSWGITASAVTSHSSGEIAAAYTVGALSLRQAMAVAYYRAAMAADPTLRSADGPKGAMVAVGVGKDAAQGYLERIGKSAGKAVVACINSPSSITIAGDESAIVAVEKLATEEGVFARKLKVETGYHSHHMEPIAGPYREALRAALAKDEVEVNGKSQDIPGFTDAVEKGSLDSIIFSSPVTGGRVTSAKVLSDPEHWVRSLLQPVRFVESFSDMVLGSTDSSNLDVILEVGPHTALGGPIKEILALPEFNSKNINIPYMGCLVRKEDARDCMLTAALNFLSKGHAVDLLHLSFPSGLPQLQVLTDLPSYPWNHSIRHWSESRRNAAYRKRSQEPHDLLGALEPGTNPDAAAWRHIVKLSEAPWLRDHVVQGNILYPGAGFVCLAIEAIKMQAAINGTENVTGFKLRDVEIHQALVIADNADGVEVQTVLRSVDSKTIGARGWRQFEIWSVSADSEWTEHARGLITVDTETKSHMAAGSSLDESGYTRRIDPQDMFASLRAKGLNHGPMFQNTLSILQDGRAKEPQCVVDIKIADVSSKKDSGRMSVLHPTTLDSIVLSSYAAVPSSDPSNDDSARVPRSIRKLWVSSKISSAPGHTFTCNVKMPHHDAQSYEANVSVVDGPEAMVEMTGLVCQSLGRSAPAEDKEPWTKELCSNVQWGPDLALSLGLPGAQDAIDKRLNTLRDQNPDDRSIEVQTVLRRVCVYFSHDALSALTKEDISNLASHHVKFYKWMQDTVNLANSCRWSSDSDTWIHDSPSVREKYIALADSQTVDGELICQLGPLLLPILRGERAPLEVMMEGRLLYKYYANAYRLEPAFEQLKSLLNAVLHKNPRARILEIGAGTGAATRHALKTLGTDEDGGPRCESWHFTDISSGFFEAARTEFATWGNLLEFNKLDIEQDPEAQGFKLGSYDVVVACQVLHATKSMHRTMSNVRSLMKPNGTLLLMETTQDQIDLQFIFGLLPGWWLSEEPERHSSPSLSIGMWDRVLKGAGFTGVEIDLRDVNVGTESDLYGISNIMSTAVDVSSSPKVGASKVVIVTSDKASPKGEWLKGLQEAIAQAAGENALPEVVSLGSPFVTADTFKSKLAVFIGELDAPVLASLDATDLEGIKTMALACKGLLWLTRGGAVECTEPESALASGFVRVLRTEYLGRRFLTLDLDPSDTSSEAEISAIVHVLSSRLAADTPAPIESEFALRDGLLLVPRLYKDVVWNALLEPEVPDWASPESIPEAPLFQAKRPLKLEVGIPGLLDTLAFGDDPDALDASIPDEMVEIEPRAYGLNFRDVMVAMGQLKERVMGLECAGIITRVGAEAAAQGFAVGDHVMALLLGPFSSRARVTWHGVINMPEGMSFEDAASIPMIFTTAYVALVQVARLSHGQSVLIHAAAGGVGQAAVMLAKDYLGAEVYATVGSQEKRDLLINEYGIPDDHIFNSRDASFAPAVLAATNGQGVDCVLNSLGGSLLQASFEVLAPFGSFVEIGKRDLEQNSLLEMGTFTRAVSFTSLDMMTLLRRRGNEAHRVMSELARLAGQGIIKPVHPVTVYPMRQVDKAFRLLQTGKHLGKLVLSTAPDEEVKVLPRPATPKLRPDASYLLVGGVGGLGRSLANWMVEHGAKNLILLSRSAGKQNSSPFINQLRAAGCRVAAISCDVSDENDLDRALTTASTLGLPAIRGVIQGAMVLQDSILEQMSIADWNAAIKPKVAGTRNLHTRFSTRNSLDFFVMLSSLSAILGWASQASYAAGGTYQDALARWRTAHGLPAVSLDMGVIKDVGYVAESRTVADRLRKVGQSLRLSEDSILATLATSILHPFGRPQLLLGLNSGPGSHWDPSSDSQMGRDARFMPLRYRKPASTKSTATTAAEGESEPLSSKLKSADSPDTAAQHVGGAIATKLADIFMVPVADIDLAKPPSAYGVDSLVAVELRNMLVLQAACDVSIFSILQSVSLAALAGMVVERSAHFEGVSGAIAVAA
ncbi:type I polyketide synthase [Aspergillus mulundensis]|uniref:Lovastatin diketide synthase lovF n=1 Tax=Aspergillus mulundensis TaxID=1810919 RepID=A0A3D8RS21_9EURO|nr:Asperfuranone polyketide synthase afoG [Aspergillus mulundensis]RDW76674.1 Asperfuranone polyketide synthase afoG [Aspergillus mulundensis]